MTEPMHPSDDLVAFRTLSQQGHYIEQIAGRYGVKEMLVRRRLALANLAAEFVDIYRDGKVSVDTLRHWHRQKTTIASGRPGPPCPHTAAALTTCATC